MKTSWEDKLEEIIEEYCAVDHTVMIKEIVDFIRAVVKEEEEKVNIFNESKIKPTSKDFDKGLYTEDKEVNLVEEVTKEMSKGTAQGKFPQVTEECNCNVHNFGFKCVHEEEPEDQKIKFCSWCGKEHCDVNQVAKEVTDNFLEKPDLGAVEMFMGKPVKVFCKEHAYCPFYGSEENLEKHLGRKKPMIPDKLDESLGADINDMNRKINEIITYLEELD